MKAGWKGQLVCTRHSWAWHAGPSLRIGGKPNASACSFLLCTFTKRIRRTDLSLLVADRGVPAAEAADPIRIAAAQRRRPQKSRWNERATQACAALTYLHATRERDQNVAAGMGKLFADAKKTSTKNTGLRCGRDAP